MKKPTFRNLLFVLIAISVAKTFRINEIASYLPLDIKKEKSKQKRFLRLLEMPRFPIDALKTAWFVSVVGWFSKDASDHLYLLVDEMTAFLTDKPNNINNILRSQKNGDK